MYFKRLQKHSDLLSRQQEVDASIGRLRRPVEDALGRKEKMLTQARPLEGQKVREMAELLAANWDKLNKLYQDRLRWAHDLPHQHHSVIRVAPPSLCELLVKAQLVEWAAELILEGLASQILLPLSTF